MSEYQRRIVYLSEAQKNELFENGSVEVDGATIEYSDSDVYMTPQVEGVTDVKVGDTSVVDSQGVANVPETISPTVTVNDIPNGHRITITDATGAHSFDVPNGEDGEGVPAGGTTGQVLSKASGTDYDTEWTTPEPGGVQDVQVNGVSVLSDGVANVPKAGASLGVVRINSERGININDGLIFTKAASTDQIKAETDRFAPIVPWKQHESSFYGLAKAAGAGMKDIASTTVGVYPEAQKSAIHEMLNGSVPVTGTTPTITALPGIRYICGEVATLDITLPASGIVDVVFESGSTPTVLSGLDNVRWANGFDPEHLDANTTYEINIADGLGVAGSWT